MLKPFDEQDTASDPPLSSPRFELSEALARIDSRSPRERERAVGDLLCFPGPESTERIIRALDDDHSRVKKAATRALVGSDDPRCEPALRRIRENCPQKLVVWVQRGQRLIADIEALREEG